MRLAHHLLPSLPQWRWSSGKTFEYEGFRVPVDLAEKTGGGPETFKQIADCHQAALRKWIGLSASDRVLEVGCGIGRDAIPLLNYLVNGSYVGVDIIKPSITWCSKNIATHNKRFAFYHFDIQDQLHNPSGTLRAEDIRLPADDKSVDKIFLFSVFTHMFRSEVEHYLSEFARVLIPGGKVYATTFLYDDAVLMSARRTNLTPWNLRFEHEIEPGVRINSLRSPRGAVAYTAEVWQAMLETSTLALHENFLRGEWSGHFASSDDGQDVAIIVKPI